MNIDHPATHQIPQLKALWKQAFGDTDEEIDYFFRVGFSENRCLQATVDGQVAAALYWFDSTVWGKKVAYLYAIATEKSFQHQGIAGQLIRSTHEHLKNKGYQGAVLVPSEESLFGFYERFGYSAFGGIGEFTCQKAGTPAPLSKISKATYANLRKAYLPHGGVLQEDVLLDCLDAFYQGEDFIFTAVPRGENLFVPELLGNAEKAPQILTALGFSQGLFRVPGNDRRFAMFCPLTDMPAPIYFGLALD